MTRKQALDKAAEMLAKAQGNTISDGAVQKYMNLAQLYLALAHESGLSRGSGSIRPASSALDEV